MLICLQTNALELRCKGTHFIGNLQNFDLLRNKYYFSKRKIKFFSKIFGSIKKKQYLCTNKLTPLPVDQRA